MLRWPRCPHTTPDDARFSNHLTLTQTLSAKAAAALDKELMSTGAFSLDQLMELAGLSVSQASEWPEKEKRGMAVVRLPDHFVQFTESIP